MRVEKQAFMRGGQNGAPVGILPIIKNNLVSLVQADLT